MKYLKLHSPLFLLILFLFAGNTSFAQTTYEDAGAYMSDISKALDKIQTDLWSYTNAVAHSKNARKIERRRMEIVETIKDAKQYVWKMPSYKGDKSLRDSAYSYLKISYAVITEDFSKLVDMEEVAEQSYDKMEAYILAKDLAFKKQDTSIQMLQLAYKAFAASHNITMRDVKSEIGEKLEAASKVYDYYNVIYLIFFKSNKQEAYVTDALNKNNISALKQNSDALLKFTAEGLQKLEAIKPFEGDASIKGVCREMLQFYKNEAETKLPVITSFLVKKETFEKIKKAIESKPTASRTKADVEAYNTAVEDFNSSTGVYNTTTQKLNEERTRLITKWNDACSAFTDRHVPN